MKIIKMNEDDKFDIDLSSINAKIDDQNLFDEIERPSIDAINKFISTTHEIKNQPKTLDTSNYYVEYKMLVKGKEHFSGIHTSKAELQTYTVDDIIHSYSTEFIYWIYKNKDRLGIIDKSKDDTDYIATGMLVPVYRIFDLKKQYIMEKRLIELNIWKK
jgi:hypothetical protein